MDALTKAIDVVGGSGELARRLGISAQAISQWEKVPATRCIAVEQATDGAVSRYELRPDIYGEAPQAAA